jgi:hypothetical protein
VLTGRLWRQNDLLDRHYPVQELIVTAPYAPHATLADRLGQQITPGDKRPDPTMHGRIITAAKTNTRTRDPFDTGGRDAAQQLARHKDADQLRARAYTGDRTAAAVLGGQSDLDELRARASTGDEYAAGQLARALEEQGNPEEAQRLRRFGLNPDGSIARA